MRPNMMVGAICVMGAAASAACQKPQPVGAAATHQPLKREAQQPARKPTTVKAVVRPAGTSPAPSKAVASNDAVPAASNPVADEESISTTITGCLVLRDDGMFQLKDNDGEHAPKARSWKSGFIKKGSATVDVFDAGNRLQLGTHVNHRISVSGTLTDRQLRARSLHVTEKECD